MSAMRGHRDDILYSNLPTAKLFPRVMVALQCRQSVQSRAQLIQDNLVQIYDPIVKSRTYIPEVQEEYFFLCFQNWAITTRFPGLV